MKSNIIPDINDKVSDDSGFYSEEEEYEKKLKEELTFIS